MTIPRLLPPAQQRLLVTMMETHRQKTQESALEVKSRVAGDFVQVERELPSRSIRRYSGLLRTALNLLRRKNPLAQPVDRREHIVWLFDNIAYRPIAPAGQHQHLQWESQPWLMEVVSCVFVDGNHDLARYVAAVADAIGLDGELGADAEVRQRVTERLQPFLHPIAPARTMRLRTHMPRGGNGGGGGGIGAVQTHSLGPANSHGIVSQTVSLGRHRDVADRARASSHLVGWEKEQDVTTMETVFAHPEGWLVVSDIDDSIKSTMTSDAGGILRSTFVEEPKPVEGMPELYGRIDRALHPAWVYISASPYNLYQFLRGFLRQHYPVGPMILRENSWQSLGGFLKSYSMGTQAYKTDRLDKVHSWLPRRKVICIGDSTQSDPESYAELYRKYPGWIQAIFIRKVVDIPHMEAKNAPERFEQAFEGIPEHVWTVFEDPSGLHGQIIKLAETVDENHVTK